MLVTADLPSRVGAQISERLSRADLGRWLAQVQQVGSCAQPIRMVGASDTINTATGEILRSYTSHDEPDGVTYLRCKNRRRAVCESCSHEYQGDVFHLVMAGAAGGMKDVPAEIVTHPLVFATLTAPSFGAVHAAKKHGQRGTRRCRPRSGDRRQLCPHGRRLSCMATHQHDDGMVGQPLCPDCYDYLGHLVWQWWAPELCRRFTINLRRGLASHLGLSETACRQLVRVQFAKVAEFQRRAEAFELPPHEFLAVGLEGRRLHPDTLTRRFNRLVDRAGVPRIRLHDVRHTYATLAMNAGVDPKVLSDRIGHANTSITLQVYAHRSTGLDRPMAEQMSRLIAAATEAARAE